MSRLTIYYGRIRYVSDQISGQTELLAREGDPIREAVEAAKAVERYRHTWVLGNLSTVEERNLIIGRLGYPGIEHRRQEDYDPETQQFVEQELDLPAAVSDAFVLDYKTGAMAFEGTEQIGPTGFVNHFVALLNASKRGTFKGELVRVAEHYREFVSKVDRIKSVSFEVRPSNPRDRAIFRPLDEGMRAANAKRQLTKLENNEEGLILNPPASPDEETPNPAVQGIEMVEEGYGEGYRIDAEREGNPLRFDSKVGGGLLRDAFEDAPDDPSARVELLREKLDERGSFLEPGQSSTPPVELEGDLDAETEPRALPPGEEGDNWAEDER
ncbi:MAG: hypothetical protein E6G56_13240 [Actinobacteria bacterium]|nr:MAG: hypothetical protein E6G56_13240 [Actinomycetota bacterium]